MPGTRLTTRREQIDPRHLPVQVAFRCPFWYREQLIDEANRLDLTVPTLVTTILESVITPKPPK
jgi:hypothetical protein